MGTTARRSVTVLADPGLHARPAVAVAECARRFLADVTVTLAGGPASPPQRADAKNVVDLLLLGAPRGSVLTLEAAGEDAERAVEEVAGLFARGFAT